MSSSVIGERAYSAYSRLPSLTGMRFIAAAMVFFFHASLTDPPQNPYADPFASDLYQTLFSKAGWMGVSFFFVLSGFVLTWSARSTDTMGGFWRRRLVKIFPAHVVTWALAMILFAAAASDPHQWLPNLFLIHSWFPQHEIFISVNPPSWSLCSELLFYMCFPFIIKGVVRIKQERLWSYAGLMILGMVGVQVFTQFVLPDTPQTPEGFPVSVWQFWFGYNFPPVRLFEFVLGMLLARIVMSGMWFRSLGFVHATVLAVAGYALAMVVPWLYGLNVATIVPIVVLVCTAATADIEGRPSVLRSRTMIWLGEVSFGFYLAQYVVIYYLRQQMDARLFSTPLGTLVLLGLFFVTLLVGWLVHKFVEKPAMRRWGRPRGGGGSFLAKPMVGQESTSPAGEKARL
ncbi:acyltransferase [Actinopolyspora lacussalsi]